MQDITIAILAGGESTRMGRDKAKLRYRGGRLLEHIANEALDVAPTLVVGRDDAEAFDLDDIPFVPDREPDLGPIGGLRTALEYSNRAILLVGCDMPRLDADAFRWLRDAWQTTDRPIGLVTETEEGLQPLFAIYDRDIRPEVSSMIESGERSLRWFVERCGLEVHPAPTSIEHRLVNVNTPDEYRKLDR